MVSINTNLSSLLVQNNLTKSTNALNQAIERMTTGFKINHASDNAANYSIAANMSSQISSYEVAQDNIASGLDMLTTAQDTISLMQSHAERIHNLITQAQNGTYGEQSLAAINSEVQARIDEINRLYATTEYNGINILNGTPLPEWTEELKTELAPEHDGFISDAKTYTDDEVALMTSVSSVTGNYANGTKYKISSAEELAKLATDVNSGKSTNGAIFVLANDIDLSAYSGGEGWASIGYRHYDHDIYEYFTEAFSGTFDGNGHVISNLTINKPACDTQGLFGYIDGGTVKNVGLKNCNVKTNEEYEYAGGLIGMAHNSTITNCFTTGNVSGESITGGLVGCSDDSTISDCFSTCNITGVKYGSSSGGLIGGCLGGDITNSYSTGNVTGKGCTGGFVGYLVGTVTNCYATGNVNGDYAASGFIVETETGAVITNCFSTGNVTGSLTVAGFLAYSEPTYEGQVTISNCCAAGNVSGTEEVGGFISSTYEKFVITNSGSYGTVSGNDKVGTFIGWFENYTGETSFDSCVCVSQPGYDIYGEEVMKAV